ncbi:DNA polymerase III subunit gamma/tau [Clostridium boliviensis]|uniref:DNA-directed DNA polymerase n=1 Tax=Clostridium boliviensis TaxID=318465 RepID=A0ABU4GJ52_9CLOT|nr:DNA polymerase III subunit gamma/tau [Clostridium boliviensis]MDW2796978.1 DNA polymerase III subunit gamma/tau [Clostridium boliviensis]
MSYTALYRKWRPSSFVDVKGQDHIVQTLKNQIISQRIGHAYLFCGTRGTGKTSIAKIFAKAVNCEQPKDGSPCGECHTCRNIAAGASLNVVEIDAASNNGVENIREIREQVQYPPTEGKYRVYIIDEVHMLSTGAFNALLKTLEEPPSYVIFILATTEVHKIPITVLSRCQRYDFKRITVETITEHLKELTEAEQIRVEEKALTYIAKSADGALRDALSLLDQCIAFHYGELLTYDNVLDVLGAVDITVFGRLFEAVAKNETKECISCLEDMVIQGRELGQFVVDFIWYLRNLLIIKSVDEADNLLDMSSENQIQLRADSALADNETLLRYIRVFSDLSNQLRYASQKRVLIEVALIKLTRPQMEQNYDSILQRLKSIEQQLESGTFLQKGEEGASSSAEAGSDSSELETLTPAQRVALPQGQLEDLNLIRGDWGNIIRELGGPIRASFRETIVEPSGESRLCVVFSDQSNYLIGSRESTIEEIERYVQDHYKKSIAFQTRLQGGNERMDTIYVSDEELKANIQMDITIEE